MGALLTYWLGITATNFESLWLLVIITNLSTLLPLPFINWLPAAEEQAETSKDGEQAFLPDLMSELVLTEPESEIVE